MDHQPGDKPPLTLFLTEPGRAVAELGWYFALLPALLALPRGDGHPVRRITPLTFLVAGHHGAW